MLVSAKVQEVHNNNYNLFLPQDFDTCSFDELLGEYE